ncbi:hypothetical protein [Nocardia altamirensis]|uniref:hypothetical protein n=1 Tax=Nocardia altamirensis TaxID=472158 RepID=UPI0008404DE3|nr:hypothetical protein [Nocardia altamirensis]
MSAAAQARLNSLRGQELSRLHATGTAPEPGELDGVLDGTVLTPPVIGALALWRGKSVTTSQGKTAGLNRIGLGPLELRRYHFTTRIGQSAFTGRAVLLLDHNLPANPFYIRRFHDELVRVDAGLYLATTHYLIKNRLRFVCYFALAQ